MITMVFRPWRRLTVIKDRDRISAFLHDVSDAVQLTLKAGMASGKSGRWYGSHRASAPGEFPAIHHGPLYHSIRGVVRRNEMEVGTNRPYSGFLARGTTKMKKRKMSKDAYLATQKPTLTNWVRFK